MTQNEPGIRGEHALRDDEPDRLGFSDVAERIALSVMDRASADGLVIGIDGEWGSGKSSLLHLIERKLNQLPDEKRPTIISFRPWLVGRRDALLSSFFNDLARKIASVSHAEGDATKSSMIAATALARQVRTFAALLGRTGELVEAGGKLWAPAEWIGKIIKGVGKLFDKGSKEETGPDLATLKARITRDLHKLGHRFIVTVDDVDRLEPSEVMEVLRLVRSVADFPNIIYLLCYDVDRLAEAIETTSQVDDGKDYLEKIVQLTVMVPQPEPFELRQWFAEDLAPLLGPISDEVSERLKSVIDQEGGAQLRTPRSVVRTLDSIRFFWPATRSEKIDAADLVWLQLIKDGNPDLYRWVETYVASVAATSFGTARVTERSVKTRLTNLLEIVEDRQLHDMLYRHFFSELLPGIETSMDDQDEPVKIHQAVTPQAVQAAIAGRRLASPDHYRLYFSLVGPSYAVTQEGFDQFWNSVDKTPAAAAATLLEFQGQKALGTLRKLDILLERLRGTDLALWSSTRATNLLLALGEMMDDAFRRGPREPNIIITTWDRAEKLVALLYPRLDATDREQVTEQLFSKATAIGWATNLLRRETFAHGRVGEQRRPNSDWVLSEEELDHANRLMIARFSTLTIDEVIAAPRPLWIFFAWNQAGDPDGPRKLLAEATRTDAGLVGIMNRLTTRIDTSDSWYTVIRRENIAPFLDYDEILARLQRIAAEGNEELAVSARRLIEAAEEARNW
ncbi:P-loop NTPase fold protein [Sphingobium sp. EM0848]|uniref:KAP family P-loop NTPase fold protein n=1 Tax=Sphingobium sp. EM0848 TaxID=2743473 RepID=UPI00159CC39C|nr:P-loop NTPase fold protein [Sphingobium sp. EM0848]